MQTVAVLNTKKGMTWHLIAMDHKIPSACVWSTSDGQLVALCLMRKDRHGEMAISRMFSWREKMSWIMLVCYDVKNVAKALDIKPIEV